MKKRLAPLLLALLAPLLAQAALRVACVGDSITYGSGLADRAAQAYPAQLQALLGPGYEVRNFGNPGRGVYLHTRRGAEPRGFRHMPEHRAALDWRPDIVVCNLGINDADAFPAAEAKRPGAFRDDYLSLLADYAALPTKPKLLIWGTLGPLAPGHRLYRSPVPFLMEAPLAEVAARAGATPIDMALALRQLPLSHFPDGIHPDAEAAKAIAQATAKAIAQAGGAPGPDAGADRPRVSSGWAEPWPAPPVALPADIAGTCEAWLCTGQSNMYWPLARCAGADAEAAATAKHDIRLWDFVTGRWRRLTPANAKQWSALAVSFALRRAEATGKPIAILLVDVGGAPTEAFLPAPLMAGADEAGKPRFPHLLRILTNRKTLCQNEDYPRTWAKVTHGRRSDGAWPGWEVGALWRHGLARLRGVPLTGILWYQGESNASVAIGGEPDSPLDEAYMEETLRAVVRTLRALGPKTPPLVMGLPRLNRPWGPYRALQRKVCAEEGAVYLDTFGAGLGDPANVHPADKRPFAALASEAASRRR